MQLSLIAAVAKNGVIGSNGNLPWNLPEDLSHFRQKTWGKAIIFGSTTFVGLPVALENRKSIVLSRQESLSGKGDFEIASSVNHALQLAKNYSDNHGHNEIFVAGGSQVYSLFFEQVNVMYITEIDVSPEGDSWFLEFDRSLWRQVESVSHTSVTNLDYRHIVYKRII